MEALLFLLIMIIISISMVSHCSSTIYYLDDPNIYNSPPSTSNNPHRNLVSTDHHRNLVSATEDMLRGNYFTFVTLINMSPPGLFQGNVTFLMPDDRALAGVTDVSPESVAGILLRHSIPSPLRFEAIRLLPSGSVLPSSDQDYTLTVNDDGRGINNARIVGPDICGDVGSTVLCHGIDSVLSETDILCY